MSNNLDITQLTEGQDNKETTINDKDGELDAAITEVLSKTIDSSNSVTITNAEIRRASILVLTPDGGDPPDSTITVTLPAIKRGNISIVNTTAQSASVTISGQSETPPVVASGQSFMLSIDGSDVRSAGGGGGGTTVLGGSTNVPAFLGCLLKRTTNQSIDNDSDTVLDFDDEEYDTSTFHDTVTNSSRITIPSGSGITKGEFSVQVEFDNDASPAGVRAVSLKKNGSFTGQRGEVRIENASVDTPIIVGFTTPSLIVAEGDYFEINVYQNSGASMNVLSGVKLHFGFKATETSANDKAIGRPPFRGCLLTRTTDALNIQGGTFLDWDNEIYDTDGFHDNGSNPSRITIPVGSGIKKIQLLGSIEMTGNASEETLFMDFRKNGSAFVPSASMNYTSMTSGFANRQAGIVSPVILVDEGDYLEFRVNYSNTTDDDILANGDTWFQVIVYEDQNTAPIEFQGFLAGTPGTSDRVWMFVATRSFTIPEDMTLSQGYAETAPSAQTDFDLQKNGSSFGTMRFPSSTKTATFIAASDTSFLPGDRLEIHTPGNLNSLADVAFNLYGTL